MTMRRLFVALVALAAAATSACAVPPPPVAPRCDPDAHMDLERSELGGGRLLIAADIADASASTGECGYTWELVWRNVSVDLGRYSQPHIPAGHPGSSGPATFEVDCVPGHTKLAFQAMWRATWSEGGVTHTEAGPYWEGIGIRCAE